MKQAALREKRQHKQTFSELIKFKWKWKMEMDCKVTML